MRNSDLTARIGAGLELMAVLFNLLVAFMWFISLVWVLVGLFWALVGLMALVEAAIAVFVLVKGYTPLGIAGPVIGIGVSVCNFNFMGGGLEAFALVLMIVGLVLRGQEDAAAAAA
jgi:hypothetical protein